MTSVTQIATVASGIIQLIEVGRNIYQATVDAMDAIEAKGSLKGKDKKERVLAFIAEDGDVAERFNRIGMSVIEDTSNSSQLIIDDVGIKSRAEDLGLDIADNNCILGIEVPTTRPDKGFFAIPGVLIFLLIYLFQRGRRKRESEKLLFAE